MFSAMTFAGQTELSFQSATVFVVYEDDDTYVQ